MSTQENQSRGVSAGRSPSYPDSDLRDCLEKARALYKAEGMNWSPVTATHEHWGYNANTGPARRAVSALKNFGLLLDQGRGEDRQIQLTALVLQRRIWRTTLESPYQRVAKPPSFECHPVWHRPKSSSLLVNRRCNTRDTLNKSVAMWHSTAG